MKLTFLIQYYGHVIHAEGSVKYRTVDIELTPEQKQKLKLVKDEDFGVVAINSDDV